MSIFEDWRTLRTQLREQRSDRLTRLAMIQPGSPAEIIPGAHFGAIATLLAMVILDGSLDEPRALAEKLTAALATARLQPIDKPGGVPVLLGVEELTAVAAALGIPRRAPARCAADLLTLLARQPPAEPEHLARAAMLLAPAQSRLLETLRTEIETICLEN